MELFTVKPGFEMCAASECTDYGFSGVSSTDGIVMASQRPSKLELNFCFPSWYLLDCEKLQLNTDIGTIRTAAQWYCDRIRMVQIDQKWPLAWLRFTDNGFLPDLSRAANLIDQIKKKVARIARLSVTEYPESDSVNEGFFIVETQEDLYCSRSAVFFGQRRMKNDPEAPSRSYLKIEEAFSVFSCMPVVGDTVVDLGAAPGGWSFAASKRGASVLAIDNGPLKKGAASCNNIKHLREDAFKWFPQQTVDWLFCDMVEEPSAVIFLIKNWLNRKLCRFAIVNLKCGHARPIDILRLVKGPEGIAPMVKKCVCKHLYHDRNEFTFMLKV